MRMLNEFFRQRANMRILKQDLLYRVLLVAVKLTDERRKGIEKTINNSEKRESE